MARKGKTCKYQKVKYTLNISSIPGPQVDGILYDDFIAVSEFTYKSVVATKGNGKPTNDTLDNQNEDDKDCKG